MDELAKTKRARCDACGIALRAVFLLIMAFVVFSFGFTPLRSDNDAWWHLKTGKYIVENRHLPEHDIFAFTSEDIEWHNHEWATQVIFYIAYLMGEGSGLGGIRALIMLKSFILIITFTLLYGFISSRTKSFMVAILFAIVAAAIARRTIYPRPPIMSYLMFTIYIWIIYAYRSGRVKGKYLWLLPILMVFWVNMHGGFILGLVLLSIYAFADVVEMGWTKFAAKSDDSGARRRDELGDVSRLRNFVLALVGCFVASLINPYTYKLYVLTYRVMSDKALVNRIPELLPPNYRFTWAYEVLILLLIVGLALRAYRRLFLGEVMVVIFFLHQSLHHVRHLPLFALAATPLCAALAAHFVDNLPRQLEKVSRYVLVFIVLIFSAWSVTHHREAGGSYLDRNLELFRGIEYYERNYPVEACDFIIRNDFSGRMFNQINHAGYLIWRLSPEHHKVFTDSRYDIFGSRFLWDEQIVEAGYESPQGNYGWRQVLDKYAINFLVISDASGLARRLGHGHPDWSLVYYWRYRGKPPRPDEYNIYVRNVPENEELIQRCLRQFEVIKAMKGYEQ